eukprot:Amastigsp_a362450_9.p3 type:complete len:100 gc:universal Amastigsp_a362450_9:578-279(-)
MAQRRICPYPPSRCYPRSFDGAPGPKSHLPTQKLEKEKMRWGRPGLACCFRSAHGVASCARTRQLRRCAHCGDRGGSRARRAPQSRARREPAQRCNQSQ